MLIQENRLVVAHCFYSFGRVYIIFKCERIPYNRPEVIFIHNSLKTSIICMITCLSATSFFSHFDIFDSFLVFLIYSKSVYFTHFFKVMRKNYYMVFLKLDKSLTAPHSLSNFVGFFFLIFYFP